MKTISLTLLGVATLTAGARAQTWTQWSQNGHEYLAVARPDGITWGDARAEALALGGDLATIDSFAENQFVFGLVTDPTLWKVAQSPLRLLGPWLGGLQPPSTSPPAAGWGWVTGELFDYTNWSPGEPNDWQGIEEDRLQFFTLGSTPRAFWNDLRSEGLMYGYVAESVPPTIGSVYCQPAIANSTGAPARMQAFGSTIANDNHVVLTTTSLPADSVGYFLNGTAPNSVLAPGSSIGRLCVGGSVGRYNSPSEIQDSAQRRYFGIALDLASTPTPIGSVGIAAGQTWYFQAWYRDTLANGQSTSNFSEAVSITFQ